MSTHKQTEVETIKSVERRNFLTSSAKYGITTALVGAGAGSLLSTDAMAITAKEEKERKT